MQDFNIFDIVIIFITILLGLKGLARGFIREVFGLIAIIGGLFVASRFASTIGYTLSQYIQLSSGSMQLLVGFIIALIIFWIFIYFLGMLVSKMSQVGGLGFLNRIAGFIFGGAKVFLIFAVVAYLSVQVQAFKKIISTQDTIITSLTFPILVETGSYIFQINTSNFLNQENKTMITETTSDVIDTVKDGTTEIIEGIISDKLSDY